MPGIEIESHAIWRRDELGRFAVACNEAANTSIEEATRLGSKIAQGLAPGRGVHIRVHPEPEGHTGRFVASGRAAMPQEAGARPHLIGRPGQTLRLPRHPTPAPVLHPGNAPHHYMLRAFEAVRARLPEIMRRNYPG